MAMRRAAHLGQSQQRLAALPLPNNAEQPGKAMQPATGCTTRLTTGRQAAVPVPSRGWGLPGLAEGRRQRAPGLGRPQPAPSSPVSPTQPPGSRPAPASHLKHAFILLGADVHSLEGQRRRWRPILGCLHLLGGHRRSVRRLLRELSAGREPSPVGRRASLHGCAGGRALARRPPSCEPVEGSRTSACRRARNPRRSQTREREWVGMVIVMADSPETTHKDSAMDVSEWDTDNFNEVLQVVGQLSAESILQTLKMLELKILSNKLSTPLCQKVTDVIVKYLRMMMPEEELEEKCTAVLLAVGSQHPRMIIEKLWDRVHLYSLPPRSLLVAIGKLSVGPGMDPCGGRVSLHGGQGHGGPVSVHPPGCSP
ncbi:hypothetical protein J0S82_008140 [Galemys pyrenaicus]|uniref:Uncharacterized protein n=1 Tax=Galemys pyrenaicus TaxID=202257 RepID=A0A8J6DH38_GALPY|nr:hypothetical protein J0S82_008140 [Galemys pyrenaicus]